MKTKSFGYRMACGFAVGVAWLVFGWLPLPAQSLSFVTNNYSVGNSPMKLAVADLASTGHPAVLTANVADQTFTILTNIGNGIFGAFTNYNVANMRCPLAGDLNGDGLIDVAAIADSATVIYTNRGGGVDLQCHLASGDRLYGRRVGRFEWGRQAGFTYLAG